MKFSKYDTVINSRTKKFHQIIQSLPRIPDNVYLLDNNIHYYEYELEEIFELEDLTDMFWECGSHDEVQKLFNARKDW